jgi:diguanylate cyclase (GGDEF)-like protein
MNQDEIEILSSETRERVAEESNLAVVLVAGDESRTVAKANNNSICEILYNSEEFAPRCAEYCGRAVPTAREAGRAVHVKCHADLNFMTVPIKTEEKDFAVIVGRTFLKSEDFRKATERASAGDWQQFPAEEMISDSNLQAQKTAAAAGVGDSALSVQPNSSEISGLPSESQPLESEISNLNSEIAVKPPAASDDQTNDDQILEIGEQNSESEEQKPKTKTRKPKPENRLAGNGRTFKDAEEAAAWRSFFGSLLDSEYKPACESLLEFMARRYGLENLAWLERRFNHLDAVIATGKFAGQSIQIKISADDERLLEVLQKETALELREREPAAGVEPQTVWLFPIAVGGEIRGALIVGDQASTENLKRQINRFNKQIAPQIEILRLREELRRQSILSDAIRRFNERLHNVEAEELWTHLAEFCAELMRAERGSLLFYDEEAQKFVVKAATGSRADIIKAEAETLGERVARGVFQSGDPLVVSNLEAADIAPAPAEWNYKTDSFISFPISSGGRKIGVLNIADRAGGEKYDAFDLELLNSIAPQLAVVLDRAALKRKAGEFEQLSVTDALTGLYNRRYLEARLKEEIPRSQRDGFALSFLMIDVDEFKPYNDRFGHGEGDRALQIVAQSIKSVLRVEDVAARYGGEEFSILLPRTNRIEAKLIAERVRQKIEQTEFPNRKVTVSIGGATCSMDCTTESLMTHADQALYRAKAKGRNNVQFYEGEESGNDEVEG